MHGYNTYQVLPIHRPDIIHTTDWGLRWKAIVYHVIFSDLNLISGHCGVEQSKLEVVFLSRLLHDYKLWLAHPSSR